MTWFTVALIAVVGLIFAGFITYDVIMAGPYKKYKLNHSLAAYAFLGPALLLLIIFVIQPIVMSLWYGFTDYYLLDPENINFVGFENFKALKNDFNAKGDIYHALKNTGHFVLFVVPLQVGTALGLALLVNKPRKGNTFFKVAYFAPVVMSLTVISLLWLRILRPDELGLMNNLLSKFDIPTQKFLNNPDQAMNWIVLISAWQGAGFQMLMFLAGLKTIPKALYEAADIDGAGHWTKFLNITLPGLKPIMVFVLLTTFVGASKIMIQPMVMIGYKYYSITLSYLIYMEGYFFKMVGYASAIALVVTIAIGAITIAQRFILKEEE